MPKKTSKATSKAPIKAPAQPIIPIPGTSIMPAAVYRIPERRPFGPGPWRNEPDKIAWTDAETGLDCIMLRQPKGELGGFVAVDEGHPLHGFSHDALPGKINAGLHKPLCYAAPCDRHAPERLSICHVRISAQALPRSPQTGDGMAEYSWWLGTIMNGPRDIVPMQHDSHAAIARERGAQYRDMAFVYAEVTKLARALKDIDLARLKSVNRSEDDRLTRSLPAPEAGDKV